MFEIGSSGGVVEDIGGEIEPEDEPDAWVQTKRYTELPQMEICYRVDLETCLDGTRMIRQDFELMGLPFTAKIYPRGHGYVEDQTMLFLEGPPGVKASFKLQINSETRSYNGFCFHDFEPCGRVTNGSNAPFVSCQIPDSIQRDCPPKQFTGNLTDIPSFVKRNKVKDTLEEAYRREVGLDWDASAIAEIMRFDPKAAEHHVVDGDTKNAYFLSAVRKPWTTELEIVLGHADRLLEINVAMRCAEQKVRGGAEVNGIAVTAIHKMADDESFKALEHRLSDMERQLVANQTRFEEELASERNARRGAVVVACATATAAGWCILRKLASKSNKRSLEAVSGEVASKASEQYVQEKCVAIESALEVTRRDIQGALKDKVENSDIASLRAQLQVEVDKEVREHVDPFRGMLDRQERETKVSAEMLSQKADTQQIVDMVGAIENKFEEALKQKKDRTEFDRDMAILKVDRRPARALDSLQGNSSTNSQVLSEKASVVDTVAMVKALEQKLDGKLERVQETLDQKAQKRNVEAELRYIRSRLAGPSEAAPSKSSAFRIFDFRLDPKTANLGTLMSSDRTCFAKGRGLHIASVNGDRHLPNDGVVYWEVAVEHVDPLRDLRKHRGIIGKVGINCVGQHYWKDVSGQIFRVGVRIDIDRREAAFLSYSMTGSLIRVDAFTLGEPCMYAAFCIAAPKVRMRIVTGLSPPERVPHNASRSKL
jgi:hypothetical protein